MLNTLLKVMLNINYDELYVFAENSGFYGIDIEYFMKNLLSTSFIHDKLHFKILVHWYQDIGTFMNP